MAACPVVSFPSPPIRRKPIVVSQRRLDANRRNAARSTGPRTPQGKARVARNAIKHGFFVAPHRWTPEQQRDLESTYAGLREDFRPRGVGEESCVWTIAHSFVRMAALLRYEGIAALEHHRQSECELEARIASASADDAALLREHREKLRRAGLGGPTIPGPRAAGAIIRCTGRLDRTIRDATSELQGLNAIRRAIHSKVEKQTRFIEENRALFQNRSGALQQNRCPARSSEVASGSRETPENDNPEIAKTNPLRASVSEGPEALGGIADKRPEPLRRRTSNANQIEKTKPLDPMITGNRHARRRAKALARRRT